MNDDFSEDAFRAKAAQDGITHISTGVAIVKDGKVFKARRAAVDFLGGSYELPGGGVDEGGTIEEGAIREVKEETGLTVSKVLGTFDGFDYSTDHKPYVRQVNLLVEVESGEPQLDPNEHDAWQWVDETSVADLNMSDDMRKCVDDALRMTNGS